MDSPSLSRQLMSGIICSPLDGGKFVPLDLLEGVISEQNIESALGMKPRCLPGLLRRKKPSDIPKRVIEQAKRVFAVLVLMDRAASIHGLLAEDLKDENLPLSHNPEPGSLLSCDRRITFPFADWSEPLKDDFVGHKQWLFLAPVLDTHGRLIEIDQDCPLPFTESAVMGSGGGGIVHSARLHRAHQKGFEAETADLQVAVKQFHYMPDFNKETDVLQKIKDLQNPHIIRHFVSIKKGNKGYIIFPWAGGGNLHEFWKSSKQEATRGRALWSLRQMLGLTTALHLLHERFECRHGDLKPDNILCIKEGGETILKIADFGISKIHHAQTMDRRSVTATSLLTPSYQGPEVEFEKVDVKDPRPRSRKYDIWSLGCVLLEFSIWLLHGPTAIDAFTDARGNGMASTESSRPLYEVTNKAAKAARVHQLVSWTMESLQNDPRCKGATALADLLGLIKDQMLQPEVDNRSRASQIREELEKIVQEAKRSTIVPLPLMRRATNPFARFRSIPNSYTIREQALHRY